MHWVETLTDEGKLRQMYRFARNGGENNEKALWRVNAKLSGMGFMSSSISPSPSCPSPLRLPPVFLSFPFSHPLHHVSYLSVSPKHVLMSPSIFYFLPDLAFIFHPCPFSCLYFSHPRSPNLHHSSCLFPLYHLYPGHLSFYCFVALYPSFVIQFFLLSSFPLTFPSHLFSTSPFSPPVPGTLPYDIKIVIAGNHELTFDQEFMADLIKQDFYYFPSASKLKPENYENVQSLLTNCIYLQDSEVTVRGFRIYGSPW